MSRIRKKQESVSGDCMAAGTGEPLPGRSRPHPRNNWVKCDVYGVSHGQICSKPSERVNEL